MHRRIHHRGFGLDRRRQTVFKTDSGWPQTAHFNQANPSSFPLKPGGDPYDLYFMTSKARLGKADGSEIDTPPAHAIERFGQYVKLQAVENQDSVWLEQNLYQDAVTDGRIVLAKELGDPGTDAVLWPLSSVAYFIDPELTDPAIFASVVVDILERGGCQWAFVDWWGYPGVWWNPGLSPPGTEPEFNSRPAGIAAWSQFQIDALSAMSSQWGGNLLVNGPGAEVHPNIRELTGAIGVYWESFGAAGTFDSDMERLALQTDINTLQFIDNQLQTPAQSLEAATLAPKGLVMDWPGGQSLPPSLQ